MPFRFNPFTDKLDLVETGSSPMGDVRFLTGNSGGPVGVDGSNNINLLGSGSTTITGDPVTSTLTIDSTDLHIARFIVSPEGSSSGANYTTIASATAAASSGDTIFICEGTYNENLTLKPGITYDAFNYSGQNLGVPADLGNVAIKGRCNLSSAGVVKFIGISFETDGDYAISITGSALSYIEMLSCFVYGSNANGILSNSSNVLSQISIFDSNIYVPSSGQVPIQVDTSRLTLENSFIRTDATQDITVVNGFLSLSNVDITGIIAISGTSVLRCEYVNAITDNVDSFIKQSGTSTSTVQYCTVNSGTFPCISVGSGCTLDTTFCDYTSNAVSGFFIEGTGTVNYGVLVAKGTAVALQGTLTANMYTVL